mmetsp:Transcript_1803/g.2409  ORF Transcript_1803/g.2409 Transcript_1803/m.2409 type:complete len:159 (+) Transcript_1803:94-570(+)
MKYLGQIQAAVALLLVSSITMDVRGFQFGVVKVSTTSRKDVIPVRTGLYNNNKNGWMRNRFRSSSVLQAKRERKSFDEEDEDYEYEYTEYYDDEIIDIDYDDSLPGSRVTIKRDPDFGTIPLAEQLKSDDNFFLWLGALFLFTCFTYCMEDIASMGLK